MTPLQRFQQWRGEKLVWHAEAVWLLDELLDAIPGRVGGRWRLHAQWGCQMGLSRYWAREHFRRAAQSERHVIASGAPCHLKDDGAPEVIAIEAGSEPQALWVRVGPVFANGKQQDEPGVWICYQEKHTASGLEGPVLLTPQVWRELAAAVEKRLQDKGWDPAQ